MPDNPLFILSTGRSGTTLLLRYLNCSENCVVWGEHNGFLTPLMQAYDKLTSQFAQKNFTECKWAVEKILNHTAITSAQDGWISEWANSGLDTDSVTLSFRNFLLSLLAKDVPEGSRWGFKEIRYGIRELEFLETLFPSADFLILIRNPLAVISSKIKVFSGGRWSALATTIDGEHKFLDMVLNVFRDSSDRKTLLVYEDLVLNPKKVLNHISRRTNITFSNETEISMLISKNRADRISALDTKSEVDTEIQRLVELGGQPDLAQSLSQLWSKYEKVLGLYAKSNMT